MNYSQCYFNTRDHPTVILQQITQKIEIYMEYSTKESLAIAEFGCGTGRIASRLGRIFGTITCLDKSEEALQILRARALQEDVKIRCILTNFERNAPIKDESFDVIILSHVLHWTSNFDKLFSNVFKFLSKGGLVLILLYNPKILKQMLFYKVVSSTVLDIQKEITPSLETIERTLYKNGIDVIEISHFIDTKKYTLDELKSIIDYKGTLALQILHQRFGDEIYLEMKTKARERMKKLFKGSPYLVENEIETLISGKKKGRL